MIVIFVIEQNSMSIPFQRTQARMVNVNHLALCFHLGKQNLQGTFGKHSFPQKIFSFSSLDRIHRLVMQGKWKIVTVTQHPPLAFTLFFSSRNGKSLSTLHPGVMENWGAIEVVKCSLNVLDRMTNLNRPELRNPRSGSKLRSNGSHADLIYV